MMDYNGIGVTGFSNLLLLSFVVLWRWICHWLDGLSNESNNKNNCKKHAIFGLLLFAPLCDLPMYVSFFIVHKYDLYTFSFHKFKAAALFGAYSLTISDWNSVLFEIQEETRVPFLCRNGSLIATNLVLTCISLLNFAYCYSFPDLDTYARSKVYVLGVFISIIAPLLLTIGMLWAGLKLSWRIQGASGSLKYSTENAKYKEFRSAVFHINIIMISVAMTILIQVLLLILNYYFGYHSDPDKSVGPELFFWTFCEWLPVWVLTLAQLYLLRSNANMRSKSVTAASGRSNVNSKHRRNGRGDDELLIEHGVSGGDHSEECEDESQDQVGQIVPKTKTATTGSSRNHLKQGSSRATSAKGSGTRETRARNSVPSPVNGQSDGTTDHDEGHSDITEPLLQNGNRVSLTSSMQSVINGEYGQGDHYHGDMDDSRAFDQSSVSAVFMSPQIALFSDYSMSQSDFLAHVRLSHYPLSPTYPLGPGAISPSVSNVSSLHENGAES